MLWILDILRFQMGTVMALKTILNPLQRLNFKFALYAYILIIKLFKDILYKYLVEYSKLSILS